MSHTSLSPTTSWNTGSTLYFSTSESSPGIGYRHHGQEQQDDHKVAAQVICIFSQQDAHVDTGGTISTLLPANLSTAATEWQPQLLVRGAEPGLATAATAAA